MPWYVPPADPPRPPKVISLDAGTVVHRIHWGTTADARKFNARVPTPLQGGRFDTELGDYDYLYAASDQCTCVDEVILRDYPFSASGTRQVLRKDVSGRNFASLTVQQEISVVDLTDASGLAAVGQDTWLTGCLPVEYQRTRQWATAIRGWAPAASGFVWRPRHNHGGLAWVLFEDHAPTTRPGAASRLTLNRSDSVDTPYGAARLDYCLVTRSAMLA